MENKLIEDLVHCNNSHQEDIEYWQDRLNSLCWYCDEELTKVHEESCNAIMKELNVLYRLSIKEVLESHGINIEKYKKTIQEKNEALWQEK